MVGSIFVSRTIAAWYMYVSLRRLYEIILNSHKHSKTKFTQHVIGLIF
jgi:hypothetical protein